MKPGNINPRHVICLTTACAFALGAAQAYANDAPNNSVAPASVSASPVALTPTATESRIWMYEKTAVSENPPIARAYHPSVTVVRADEPLPQLVVPLNIDMRMTSRSVPDLNDKQAYERDVSLREIDLIEDSPLFIGAQGATEFDTRDAMKTRAAYPKSIEIDPLYTLAGAGVETSF